jgi:Uma2 family endonuclease
MITTVKLEPAFSLSPEQFYHLCRQNPDLKFERNTNGELIIMPPTGGETGRNNATLISRFVIWNETYNLGIVFDSSTCFRLPLGSDRSPDVSWVKKERWEKLTDEEKSKFPPLCPDFVLELLSPSDNLATTQGKMEEYLDNGAKLGWLINPQLQQVEIYRPQQPLEILQSPTIISGESVLANFDLNLAWLWQS